MSTECVPAVGKKAGQYINACHGRRLARTELIKRDGPPPFPQAVCRHLCKNDSLAPNGFVCTLHTVWGTQKENVMDRSEETRKVVGKKRASAGGKTVGSIERTCPYCSRTIKGPTYFRHLKACKHKPEEIA
jgi:hypothetical protein